MSNQKSSGNFDRDLQEYLRSFIMHHQLLPPTTNLCAPAPLLK